MTGEALISVGFALSGGDETIDIFAGTVRSVRYVGEECQLTLVDKFQQLSDRLVGTDDDPATYVGSNYLPSDLAWWAITSYGGFSTTTNSSNTDIDYAAFAAWAAVFSGDGVYMEAKFDGQKVTEVLRKIALQTNSAIYVEQNKVSFKRFSLVDQNVSSLGPSEILDIEVGFDIDDVINRWYVAGDLTVGSVHQFTIVEEDTASVNSFGQKEEYISDDNLWFVDSSSAINLAQRLVLMSSDPDDEVRITSGLQTIHRSVGETIQLSDPFMSLYSGYRIMEQEIDTEKGTVKLIGDKRQFFNAFTLNTSSLDGSDILS
jgi:hypothetical protein